MVLDDVIVRVMKCVIYSCLPSGRGCAAGGGTGYKSNEICIILYLLGGGAQLEVALDVWEGVCNGRWGVQLEVALDDIIV